MAEVSFLHLHQHDDEVDDRDDVVVSSSSHNNWSHDHHHHHHSDLDFPPADDFFCHTDRNLLDRENQVNFVIDMFYQRVEQSQLETDSRDPDRNEDDLDVDFGLGVGVGLGFHVEVNNNTYNDDHNDFLGFMLADCVDDFVISRTTTRGDQSAQSQSQSGDSEYFIGEFTVPDFRSNSNVTIQNEIELELELNANENLEWEEIDDIFESEPDDDTFDSTQIPLNIHESHEEHLNTLQLEVLLNIRNLQADLDSLSTQNELLFRQFTDNNNSSSTIQPPASTTAINNLQSITITNDDFKNNNNNTLCAICKDEFVIGLITKQLPCGHRYHGDCIIPWLNIRNTCPICRHELLTDDHEYERRKSERAAEDIF